VFEALHRQYPSAPLLKGAGNVKPMRWLTDYQFDRTLTIIKLHLFDSMSQAAQSTSPLNRTIRAVEQGKWGTKHSQYEADRFAANFLNEAFGGVSNARMLEPALNRTINQILFLTPRFTQVTTAMALRPLLGGMTPESAMARGFWVRMLSIATIAAATSNVATTGEIGNVTDPTKPDYLMTDFGGVKMNWLGRHRSFFMALVNISEDLTTAAPGGRTFEETDGSKFVDRLRRLYRGRAGVVPSIATQLATQKDYLGRPILGPGESWKSFKFFNWLVEELTYPVSVEQALEDSRNNEKHWANIGAYVFGLSVYPENEARENVRSLVETSLATHLFESGRPDAAQLAKEAMKTKSPFEIRVEGRLLDIDKEAVLADAARRGNRLKYNAVTGDYEPDIEYIAKYGRVEITAKEAAEQAEDDKRQFFDLLKIAEDTTIRSDQEDSDTWYASGDEFRSLAQKFGENARAERELSESAQVKFSDVTAWLEREYAKKLGKGDVTEKQAAFRAIRTALDSTAYPDGTTNFWQRRQVLDELDLKYGTKLTDDFFHDYMAERAEPELKTVWRWAQDSAQPYFDIAVRALGEADYNQWRKFDAVRDDRIERTKLLATMSQAEISKVAAADRTIQAEQIQTILGPDGYSIELALWLLNNRRPRRQDLQRDALTVTSGAANARTLVQNITQSAEIVPGTNVADALRTTVPTKPAIPSAPARRSGP
jgi:hypothetical protein